MDAIKKRKWDQDDQTDNSPLPKVNKVDVDPAKAASEAAARINALLAKKGIPLNETTEPSNDDKGGFVKDITINDLKNRYMLIKGATHTQIQEETGASIVTRGKYYADPSAVTEKEPLLHLHITASSQESLDKAICKVEELIEASKLPMVAPKEEMKRPEKKFFEKVMPVEVNGTPHFNLRAKIVGPSGSYVKHINQTTGCRVQLKGRGSGFIETATGKESEEPLHVHLFCTKEEGLEAAIKLTQDLLDTVKAEAERGPSQYQHGYARGGYNRSNGGGYNNYNHHQYNSYNTSNPNSSTTPSTESSTTNTTTPAAEYDYEAYNNYYNSYYAQQGGTHDYQHYDANAYYNYYGYTAPESTEPSIDSNPSDPNHVPPPPSSSDLPPPPPPPSV